MFTLPVNGLTDGTQPVLGFNYGAKRLDRVRQGIRFMSLTGLVYTCLAWGAVLLFGRFLCGLFTTDP